MNLIPFNRGGKDPAIICADVDIKSIAPKVHVSLEPELQIPVCLHYQIAQLAWLNSGQVRRLLHLMNDI